MHDLKSQHWNRTLKDARYFNAERVTDYIKQVEERYRDVLVKRSQFNKSTIEYKFWDSLVYINHAMLKHIHPTSKALDFKPV